MCTKLNACRKYLGKTSSLNLKLGFKKITGGHFDLSVQCSLTPFFYVGPPIALRTTCAGRVCDHQHVNYWSGEGEHKKLYGCYNDTESRSVFFYRKKLMC